MLLSPFYLTSSINTKHQLISIKRIPSKENYITIFTDALYIYNPKLNINKRIYEFKNSQISFEEKDEIIYEEFKYKDVEYFAWLMKSFLFIYNTEDKSIIKHKLNIEENLEPFNMKIKGQNLEIFLLEGDSLQKKIIKHKYYLNENLEIRDFINEKEIFHLFLS